MRKILSSVLFAGALFGAAASAQAATYTWVGPSGGAWNIAANWSPAAIPGLADSVIISGKKKVAVPVDVAIANLTVGAGAEIKNGGKIKISGKTTSTGLFTGTGTVDVPLGATADFTVDSSSDLATGTTATTAVVFAPIVNKGSITTKVAPNCRVDFASIDNTGSTQIVSDGTVTFKDIKNTKSLDVSASGVLTLAKIENATGATLSISASAPTSPLIAAPLTASKTTRATTAAIDPSVILLESLTNRKGGKVKLSGVNSGRRFKGKAIANEGDMQLSGAQLLLESDVVNAVGATLTIDSDATVFPSDGTAPKLKNAGKIIKAAGSDATLNVEWTSAGQLVVEEGTLHVRVPLGKGCKQIGGTTTLEGGVLSVEDALTPTNKGTFEVAGGVVDGIGTIDGNVLNSAGTFKPGHSPGTITINGNFTQTSGGVLNMEVGGSEPGTGYDQILVNGTAYLGGTLNLVRWNNYVPKDGDVYTMFTYYSKVGTFAKFVDVTPAPGFAYDTTLTPTDYEVSCYAVVPDTTPPTTRIVSPVDGGAIPSVLSATGNASDLSGIKGITCLLYRYPSLSAGAGYWAGGTAWTLTATAINERPATGTTAWTFNFPTLTPGRYWLRARGTDMAGNSADSGTVWFWVDPNAPSTLSILTPLNGSTLLLPALPALSGSVADATNGSGIASVQGQLRRLTDGLYWNGTGWTTTANSFSTTVTGTLWTRATSLPMGTNLKSGRYTLTVTATDGAGNKKVTSSTFTVGLILGSAIGS
ncbi:hypothetical protein EON83_26485 [bacterium]|nr:MAG: hypothetical protein EON83_26485 [bacterium]